MSLTMESVNQILDVLNASENCALNLDAGDVKITIVKGNIAAPAATPVAVTAAPVAAAAAPVAVAAAPPAAAATPAAPVADIDVAGLVPITASVTSIFYRKPSPDEPPFVEVGDMVQNDTVVCLLEVMKCFRQVTANAKGRIAKILVDSGDLVQSGTVMFLVDPQ
jgi:acetyl-CoA carboxylase biotin carboxyl carrier protein